MAGPQAFAVTADLTFSADIPQQSAFCRHHSHISGGHGDERTPELADGRTHRRKNKHVVHRASVRVRPTF